MHFIEFQTFPFHDLFNAVVLDESKAEAFTSRRSDWPYNFYLLDKWMVQAAIYTNAKGVPGVVFCHDHSRKELKKKVVKFCDYIPKIGKHKHLIHFSSSFICQDIPH